MIFTMVMMVNVSAAETEIWGGDTSEQAVEVSLNTEYAVSVDESFEEDYFAFTTTNEGFYEVISVANNNAHAIQILSASEKELAEGTFYNEEKVLGEKLDANETYLIKISKASYYGKTAEGKYFFEINYKEDKISDNINEAILLSLCEKVNSSIDGYDDVDCFSYVNNSNEMKTITISLANASGLGKWASIYDEHDAKIEDFNYWGNEIRVNYTRDKDFEIRPNQQIFIKVYLEHENRYVIGDNNYCISITEKQCEHKKTSKSNYVTEYEEIRGDENNHYIIKYYDKICDECGEIVEKRIQESKYSEKHNFNENYCNNCEFEKESELIDEPTTPIYTPIEDDDEPTNTDCPHKYSYTSFGESIELYTDIEHLVTELTNRYCTSCNELLHSEKNQYTKQHNFINEECYICGYKDTRFCYNDVPRDYYKANSIYLMNDYGILRGDDYGNFRPYGHLTRSEAAAVMYRFLKYGTENFYTETDFVDVPSDHWASGCIKTMTDVGIIHGYGNGFYGPEDKLTYFQFVTLLVNGAGYENEAIKEGGYPYGHFSVANRLGYISDRSGKDGNYPIEREDVADILARAIKSTEFSSIWNS